MSNSKMGSASAALLSAEAETELARRIEAGVLARELLARELLARELLARELLAGELLARELLAGELPAGEPSAGEPSAGGCSLNGVDATAEELRWLVHDGELAQQAFVHANLRLVAMVAGQFASRAGLSRAELFQEGCVGLLLAVERFDHRRSCRFATYALFWIRALIGAASARAGGAADLPARRAEELRAFRGLEGELAQRFGRTATVGELAAAAGRSADWVAGMAGYEAPQSLESLGDVELRDLTGADPAETVGVSARPGRELLWHLGVLERRILELRMGFGDGRPHSYAEVARTLSLPVARIRRTELRALERLRAVCPADAAFHL